VLFLQEPWQGREFEGVRGRLFGNVQLFRWLRPYSNLNFGDAIYYDEIDPFLGRSVNVSAGAIFQPNGGSRRTSNTRTSPSIARRPARRRRHRLRCPRARYTLNIVNTRTTFQFSKEFAIRAIVQYDSPAESRPDRLSRIL
jgi:hypothetical protein